MIRQFEFHPDFERDVQDFGEWLEGEAPNMGETFALAVDEALARLADMPERFRFLSPPYRRILIRRFKVLIPFRLTDNGIRILGVVHGSRDIERWLERRKS